MADELVAIVFDKPTRADEVLLNLAHLQQEGAIKLADAVVVTKPEDGKAKVRQTVDVTPGKGAFAGGWWGLLLGTIFAGPVGGIIAGVAGGASGALYGRLIDIGLDDGWVRQMADWIDPGTSALLLLVHEARLDEVLGELRRFEGHVVTTTLPDEVRARLEDALRDQINRTPADGTSSPY
jgi:uncharacterized membrane protein